MALQATCVTTLRYILLKTNPDNIGTKINVTESNSQKNGDNGK